MSLQRSLVLLALGIATAAGQQPAPPPGVPVPGAAVPAPAGAPANQVPPADLGKTKITAPIEELKLSGDALAGLYRKYTGRRVIVSTAASTAEFRFVQDASPTDPLTYEEAAQLLRKAAILENFVFAPDSANPNLDILTVATRPQGLGVDIYNENSELPAGDEVISYVMSLSYIKPAEAVNTFTQIIGQFGSYGSIAPVQNAAAIVITENTSLIRKLIELKKEIDKPSSQVGTRFIKVQYADVTEIATTLTELLTAQQSAQTTAGVQRANIPQNNGAPQAPGQGGSASGETTPVQIIPDPRTNRIFAMGRPVDLVFVEGLVREFDVETSEKNFLRRKLRFLKASDFLTVAENALNRAFTGTGGGAGGATQGGGGGGNFQGGNRNQQQQGGNRQQTSNTGRTTTNQTGANFGGSTSSGGGTSSGGSGGTSLGDPSVDNAPQSILVGRTLLVADQITNSIVVQGPPSGLEIVERLLDQIDVKPEQVMISTVIGQLKLTDGFNFGVDYLVSSGDFAGRAGSGGIVPGLPIIPIAGTPFNPGSLSGSGLSVYGKVAGDLSVYLRALQENTDFTVLSRPSIFTANNQKGLISSGERIAIPTSSNSFSNGGASTNIEYQDVVLKLEVIPQINANQEVSMQISMLSDEVNGNQVIAGAGSNGEDLSVPRISTRELLTQVTIPDNQTIVLGGLIISRDTKEKSGIPILNDIPLIGPLFGRTVNNKDRTELMVFIQPSIVNSDRTLEHVQTDTQERYKVTPAMLDMADGPGGVNPDVTPLYDKSGSHKPATAYKEPKPARTSTSTVKPSLRPPHRP